MLFLDAEKKDRYASVLFDNLKLHIPQLYN